MSFLRNRLAGAAVVFLAFLALAYAALHLVIRSEAARSRVQAEIGRRTGYDVRIEDLRLTLALRIVASGVTVAGEGQTRLEAKRLVAFLLPWDPFFGRISGISLTGPVLRMPLRALFGSTGETAPRVSIGALTIDNGRIVLETGAGDDLAFESIFLDAENVSLGEGLGLRLRAHVPALNGDAVLSLSGDPGARRAELSIEQRGESKPPAAGRFEARFQMKSLTESGYGIAAAGTADDFRIGTERLSGRFDSLLEIDPAFRHFVVSLNFEVPRAARLPQPLGRLAAGPLEGSLRGRYVPGEKTLELETVKAVSAAGTLDGDGSVRFDTEPASVALALRLRDVPLDSLKPLLPEPINGLVYVGKLAADLKVTGPYRAPRIAGTARTEDAGAGGKPFSVSQLSFELPFRWADSSFEIKAGRIHGRNLTRESEGAVEWRVAEAALSGADLLKQPGKPLRASAEFQIAGGRFSTPDPSRAGERLAARGRLSYSAANGAASFTAEARVESLEFLWDQFFADFRAQKPAISASGTYSWDADELSLRKVLVALDSVGRVEASGRLRGFSTGPTFEIEIRSDDLRAGGLYDFFVRAPFQVAYPALARTSLSGTGAFAARASGNLKAFTLEGRLRLGEIHLGDQAGAWSVGPIALDLPFRVLFPDATGERAPVAPPPGMLEIGEIKTASTTVSKISARPVLWGNALRFTQPIRLSLFGGTAVIDALAWRDVIAAPRDVSFSLALDRLRLLELTEALGWYPFGGTLSGAIPRVRWAGESLRSEGTIALEAFGGKITVKEMEVEKPLSRIRSIKMDAALEGLDLEQASETFAFGRISGILSGTIDDLVITAGEPSQFRADIHSVEKPGVSQWISVEALDKITILSSGNEAGAIYGGLAGFFDSFRYSRLGFRATLRNDRLVLRGIESRDGQEFLVVGTLLPPTVNIISHTQEIAFGELVRRLQRVQKQPAEK